MQLLPKQTKRLMLFANVTYHAPYAKVLVLLQPQLLNALVAALMILLSLKPMKVTVTEHALPLKNLVNLEVPNQQVMVFMHRE